MDRVAAVLDETGLWHDLTELPETLAATLDARAGFAEVAALLGAPGVKRIVASGNGAAYYVCLALWLASLEGRPGPEVLAVPSGLLARDAFAWRPGDVLLAVSSSGEFRDLIEAIDGGAPAPFAAVTSTPGSTIGSRAGACALVAVAHQRAVTHTQAFCGNVVAALGVWAKLTSDPALASALARLPEQVEAELTVSRAWAAEAGAVDAANAVVFGSGPAWAAALEAALLLKEVSGLPAEGVETREGATSTMMALRPGDLALSLPTRAGDGLLAEAEEACAGRGARVLQAPVPATDDRRLAAVSTFPAAAVLSASIGLARGLDVDAPAWTDAYYRVARGPA
jgi:fructoselysine-6-P-deglycase FrlB-like protein